MSGRSGFDIARRGSSGSAVAVMMVPSGRRLLAVAAGWCRGGSWSSGWRLAARMLVGRQTRRRPSAGGADTERGQRPGRAADTTEAEATDAAQFRRPADGRARRSRSASRSRSSGSRQSRPSTEATLEVPIDYADPDGGSFELYVARHPPSNQDEQDRHACWSTRAVPASRAPISPSPDQTSTASPLLERFDIIGWDPRGAGLSEPAIDCIDDYDQHYAGSDSRLTTTPSARQLVDLAEELRADCADEQRRDHRSTSARTTAPATSTSIRRALGEDQISFFGFSYGSELGGNVGDAVPRHGAGDGPRRRRRSQRRRARALAQQVAGFEAVADDIPRPVQRRPGARSTTMVTPRARSTRSMLKLDAKPIPSLPDRPVVTAGRRAQGRRGGAVIRGQIGRGCRRPSPTPSRATVSGCSRSGTRTSSTTATGLGQRVRSVPGDRVQRRRGAADGRGGGRHRAVVQRGRAEVLTRHHRELLLHVLPRVDRPPGRDHR